jgi:uncharacterized coiled-coil protein SlyX
LRLGLPVVLVLVLPLSLFALSPIARAVDPPPDGGDFHGNTAEGDGALNSAFNSVTGGWYNTALGYQTLLRNGGTAGNLTIASDNTATGAFALNNNTTGFQNTATGAYALNSNTTANYNTANGNNALYYNAGDYNTANGFQALHSNGTGSFNTANGTNALYNNAGDYNTANGFQALYSNGTGDNNTANGAFALSSNTTGSGNTATGWSALQANSTGGFNAASGNYALYSNTTGDSNVATGVDALYHNRVGHDNTAEGYLALLNCTGSNNAALGSGAGISLTAGSNNIDIGAPGVAGESNKIRIGKQGTQNATFIAGISGSTVASGVGVIVNSSGKLGTVLSSARFKEAIKPMDKASEAILGLKPVTFRYKHELDPDRIPQFGLIAEQVEKVNPDLVVRDDDGKVNTVRYEAVNAMLLNEFLKEHLKVEEQERKVQEQAATTTHLESTVAKQNEMIAKQQKQIEALTATVQKVSDQIALSKHAPQLVANH